MPNQPGCIPKKWQKHQFYLLEEPIFWGTDPNLKLNINKLKLVLHRASMKYYENELKKSGYNIKYLEEGELQKGYKFLGKDKNREIYIFDPTDHLLLKKIYQKYRIKSAENYNIGIEEFKQIANSDLITIGAHTINHPILRNEKDAQARWEIGESVEKLSDMLGRKIRYFAYPNGEIGLDFDSREQLILKENKIKLAFTTNQGFFNKKTNPLNIFRSGFVGSARENIPWVVTKLLLMPLWDMIRSKKEREEREQIKKALTL